MRTYTQLCRSAAYHLGRAKRCRRLGLRGIMRAHAKSAVQYWRWAELALSDPPPGVGV